MNPLRRYRQAQLHVRELFAPFTRAHCPSCATPCCTKPTWVRPTDIILVEELGYRIEASGRPVAPGAALAMVDLVLGDEPPDAGAPCDFLAAGRGCTFPADLRPLGCAAYICRPMRAALSAAEMAPVESAVAELERAHQLLMAALYGEPESPESTPPPPLADA